VIDLTYARQRCPAPSLIDNGSELTPFLGGVSQRLDRGGSRHSVKVTFPTMPIEPDGRRWISRLVRAKQEGGIVAFPQVNFDVGAPGSPNVATATGGGRSLPITGGTPGYAIREGQALTLTSGGRGYFYLAAAQTILDASGAGTITLDVPLRLAAAVGDSVNLARPTIEGWISGDGGDTGFGWTVGDNRTVALAFTVTERA
jgi:hypothetical protein